MGLWFSKKETFLSYFLIMFIPGLWLAMRFIAISMVSWSGILLKILVRSEETRNFLEIFALLI